MLMEGEKSSHYNNIVDLVGINSLSDRREDDKRKEIRRLNQAVDRLAVSDFDIVP